MAFQAYGDEVLKKRIGIPSRSCFKTSTRSHRLSINHIHSFNDYKSQAMISLMKSLVKAQYLIRLFFYLPVLRIHFLLCFLHAQKVNKKGTEKSKFEHAFCRTKPSLKLCISNFAHFSDSLRTVTLHINQPRGYPLLLFRKSTKKH